MPGRHLGRRGVAGFFEEIPAAATAIVALLLFFSAVNSGLNQSYTSQQSSQFDQQAETFLEGLVSYQNWTHNGESGILDLDAMMALTVNDITYDFHPPFHFNVTVADISLYHDAWQNYKTLETSTFPSSTSSLSEGWVRDSTTVSIWVPPYHAFEPPTLHAATLTVVIWE